MTFGKKSNYKIQKVQKQKVQKQKVKSEKIKSRKRKNDEWPFSFFEKAK